MRTGIILASLAAYGVWLIGPFHHACTHGLGPDVGRQWIVTRYVRAGENPYALAAATLDHAYGPPGAAHIPVHSIPTEVPAEIRSRIDPELGPPEATYPPPALALFALTLGNVPAPRVLLLVWFGVNAILVVLLWAQFTALYRPEHIRPGPWALLVAALLLLFVPCRETFFCGQFSLGVLLLLMLACDPRTSTLWGGLALGLALVKPSLALPFLVVPLSRGQWGKVVLALGLQGSGLLGLSVWLHTSPLQLVQQWLAVSSYFMWCDFTVQLMVIWLHWRATPLGLLVSLGLLGLSAWLTWRGRHHSYREQIAFVGVASLMWTYHLAYDFVALLPAFLLLLHTRSLALRALIVAGVFLVGVRITCFADFWVYCPWALKAVRRITWAILLGLNGGLGWWMLRSLPVSRLPVPQRHPEARAKRAA